LVELFYSGLSGIHENFVRVDIDADLIYIGFENDISADDYDKFEDVPHLKMCQQGLVGFALLSKKNFIDILTIWLQLRDQKPPFILLYQNDKDWYELLPCQSEEEMDKFVTDHS